MSSQNAPRRNEFIDYAKGILIFLVTLGHAIQAVIYRDYGFFQDPLFQAIYMFHMALFMALAGYVAHRSIHSNSLGTFLGRRLINLVLPIFSWSLLAFLALSLFQRGQGWLDLAGGFLKLFFNGLWFLWALFEASVVVAVLKRLRCDTFLGAAVSTVLACWLVPDTGKLYLFKYLLPFFWAGYLVVPHQRRVLELAGNKWVVVVAAAASVLSYYFWNQDTYVYVSRMTFTRDTAGLLLFRFAASLVTSMVALRLIHEGFHRFPSRLVVWLGTKSLYLFILQGYCFAVFLRVVGSGVACPPYAIALSFTLGPVLALAMASGLAYASGLIEKFPLAALWFFGKKVRG